MEWQEAEGEWKELLEQIDNKANSGREMVPGLSRDYPGGGDTKFDFVRGC